MAQHRDGLSLMDPMVVWLDRLGLFDRSQAPGPTTSPPPARSRTSTAKLTSTPGFLWMVSEGNDRVTQVNAGRAYARVQLAATAQGVAMQPLQQALQEYPEQAGPHAEIRRLLGADAPAQTVQMWARVGFAPPVEPAPRRGVDAHILRHDDAACRSTDARQRECPGVWTALPACARVLSCDPRTPRARDRATEERILAAVGEVLARDGFGAHRRQRHRARGRCRQGADLPLLRRPARAAAHLGRAAGASGRRVDELLGDDPQAMLALPLRRALCAVLRPLHRCAARAAADAGDPGRRDRGTQRTHRDPRDRARAVGRSRSRRCSAATEFERQPHLRGITLLLVAGVMYLLVRSRTIRIFGGDRPAQRCRLGRVEGGVGRHGAADAGCRPTARRAARAATLGALTGRADGRASLHCRHAGPVPAHLCNSSRLRASAPREGVA